MVKSVDCDLDLFNNIFNINFDFKGLELMSMWQVFEPSKCVSSIYVCFWTLWSLRFWNYFVSRRVWRWGHPRSFIWGHQRSKNLHARLFAIICCEKYEIAFCPSKFGLYPKPESECWKFRKSRRNFRANPTATRAYSG